jgi:uncharacterized DUF497 family protein
LGVANPRDLLAASTGFKWDEGNAEKIRARHQVTRGECEEVFFNAPLLLAADEEHSLKEPRSYALGKTDAGRQLFLVFTVRGDRIRVISARDMSRRERKAYQRAQEETDPGSAT